MSGDESDNHWPGYVDALTTMTMILIFVMMILSVAFFSVSSNASRDLVERIASSVGVKIDDPDATGDQLAEKLVAVIDREREVARHASLAPPLPPPAVHAAPGEVVVHSQATALANVERNSVRVDALDTVLTITFLSRATGIDPAAQKEIDSFIDAARKSGTEPLYDLRAYASARQGTLSDSRRIAYYRAMAARTRLIAQGVRARLIAVHIEDRQTDADIDRVRVFLLPATGRAVQ